MIFKVILSSEFRIGFFGGEVSPTLRSESDQCLELRQTKTSSFQIQCRLEIALSGFLLANRKETSPLNYWTL